MGIKFVDKLPPSDRRAIKIKTGEVIIPGQIVAEDASRELVLQDGDTGTPYWAFTDSERVDASDAEALTVVHGPFTADIDTDGYVGTPSKEETFEIGAGGNAGKLVALAVTDGPTLQQIVAYCERPPDADGFARFRIIR